MNEFKDFSTGYIKEILGGHLVQVSRDALCINLEVYSSSACKPFLKIFISSFFQCTKLYKDTVSYFLI